jgi:hypothetical protein
MNKLWAWIKKHPWLTGAIVFVVGAAWLLTRSSGSSGTSSGGVSSAQTAADAQVALGQIAAGTAANNTAAAVTVAGLQAATAQQSNSLTAGVDTASIQSGSNTQLGIAADQTSVANTSTAATLQSNLAQISALEAIALAPYNLAEDQLNHTNNSPDASVTQLAAVASNVANIVAGGGSGLGVLNSNDINVLAQYSVANNTTTTAPPNTGSALFGLTLQQLETPGLYNG